MQKPPLRKTTQQDHIKTALRLPPDVYEELKAAALYNGRSINAEIIARVREASALAKMGAIERGLAEIKNVLRELRDK